jgi:hypothetical protein
MTGAGCAGIKKHLIEKTGTGNDAASPEPVSQAPVSALVFSEKVW